MTDQKFLFTAVVLLDWQPDNYSIARFNPTSSQMSTVLDMITLGLPPKFPDVEFRFYVSTDLDFAPAVRVIDWADEGRDDTDAACEVAQRIYSVIDKITDEAYGWLMSKQEGSLAPLRRCATCKWYVKRNSQRGHLTDGYCNRAGSGQGKAYESDSLAWAQDADLFRAWLNVSPEFGCVQWSVRCTQRARTTTEEENDEA